MKKTIAALSILLVFVLSLTGCTDSGISASQASLNAIYEKPVYDWGDVSGETVTLWTTGNELDRSYMTKLFERYESMTGNFVKIVNIPKEEFVERTAKALASDGERPDVLVSYGGANIENYDPDTNFYDFTDAPWVDDLTRTSINQTIYNGRVIGLPHGEASISGTLYNKKLFQKHDIEVPKTQAEFLEVCQKLLDQGITPLYLPYAEVSMLLYQFPLDTLVQDAEVLSGLNDGSLNYVDMPELVTMLDWYRTMAECGYLGNGFEENNWAGMDNAMKSGEYGMMLCWDTWLYTDYTGDPDGFGLMPAFMGVADAGTFEGPNLSLLIVNKNAPHLEVALNLIQFAADPYNYNVAFGGINTAPVFKNQVSSISTPQYVAAERLIDENFRDSTAWLRIRGFSQMDAVYIQQYMTGKADYTAQDCLRDMDTARKNRAAASGIQ